MPSVCVNDCGLTVDGTGQLALDWSVVGTARAAAQSSSFTIPPEGINSDYVGPYGLQRLTYTNSTCRAMLIEYQAYVPYVSMDMGDGNWWSVALYWTHSLTAAPPSNSFNGTTIAVARANHWQGLAGAVAFSAPVPGRVTQVVVQPGQTLYMMASTWKRITNYTVSPSNRIYVDYVALQYRRSPLA